MSIELTPWIVTLHVVSICQQLGPPCTYVNWHNVPRLEESCERHDDLVLVLPLHAVEHHVTVADGGGVGHHHHRLSCGWSGLGKLSRLGRGGGGRGGNGRRGRNRPDLALRLAGLLKDIRKKDLLELRDLIHTFPTSCHQIESHFSN